MPSITVRIAKNKGESAGAMYDRAGVMAEEAKIKEYRVRGRRLIWARSPEYREEHNGLTLVWPFSYPPKT